MRVRPPASIAPGHRNVIVLSPKPMHVILVPFATTRPPGVDAGRWETLHQNYLFGKQWASARPERTIFAMPLHATTIRALRAILLEAAGGAHGKEIILFVGHGGAGSETTMTAFDALPELTPFEQHVGRITEDVVLRALEIVRAKWLGTQAAADPNTGAQALPQTELATGAAHVTSPTEALANALVDVGQAMRDNNVTRFTVLTCNVAHNAHVRGGGRLTGPEFAQRLADVLQTDVRVYDGWIATAYTDETQQRVRIWITRDHDHAHWDRPDPDTNSLTEIPDSNAKNDGRSVTYRASRSPP